MLVKKYFIAMLLILSSISNSDAKSENFISKTLSFKASKSQIWSALTDEAELGKWWNKGVKLEPFIGGEFYEPWGDNQLATGKVKSLKVENFIEFTWKEKYWNKSEITLCRFIIETQGENTIFKVKHSGWESFKDFEKRNQMINGFSKGWDMILPKLRKYIESKN